MAKNYYFDLAAILGVEIDEVFKISNKKNTYYISEEKGLVRVDERGYEYHGLNIAETLAMLFSGQLVVKRLPFIPKDGQYYYYPSPDLESVQKTPWEGNDIDYMSLVLGMCYRSEADAWEHFSSDYKKLTGKELRE